MPEAIEACFFFEEADSINAIIPLKVVCSIVGAAVRAGFEPAVQLIIRL
jgi:hypothetical protein